MAAVLNNVAHKNTVTTFLYLNNATTVHSGILSHLRLQSDGSEGVQSALRSQ